MNHATMDIHELERVLCREVGCRAIWWTHGAPVVECWYCLRCGKFWRDDR